MKRRRWYLAGVAVAAIAAPSTAGLALAGSSGPKLTKVTIQLKWVTQAQFAGYYAAKAKGYYKDAGLDVNLKVGGPGHRQRADGPVESGRVRRQLVPARCSRAATRATTS